MYCVEYTGIDWHAYYQGSNEFYGKVTRTFDTLEEAKAFAKGSCQDDCGLGDGSVRTVDIPPKNTCIYPA